MSRSSIFNSSTYEFTWKKQTWFVLFVILIVIIFGNILAMALAKFFTLKPKPDDFRQLLQYNISQTQKSHADIWMLGNSVLHFGVDKDYIEKITKKRVLKLPVGGSTVRLSSAVVKSYLRKNKPETIVLIMTIDDLNINGYRADISSSALKEINNISLARLVRWWLPICRLRSYFDQIITGNVWRQSRHKKFEGVDSPKHRKRLKELAEQYNPDLDSIKTLSQICNQNKINLVIVMAPTLPEYRLFGDQVHPEFSYKKLNNSIKIISKSNDFVFIDYSSLFSTHDMFWDTYHLNKKGAKIFTVKLTEDIFETIKDNSKYLSNK